MNVEQEFVEYIVKTLVNKPDDVRVESVVDDRGVLLTLHVDEEDLGRVIGKAGSTAQSLRVLLRALGSKNEARYNLRIADGTNQDGRSESRFGGHSRDSERDSRASSEPKASEVEEKKEVETPEEESPVDKVKSELAEMDSIDI